MQITIKAIKRTPRIAKSSGKPFVSVGIKTDQHGDQWLSGFANVDNADWEVGSLADIEVEQKGEYLNFKNGAPRSEARESGRDSGPAAGNPATSELKNILNLQIMPILERNNAGILNLERKINEVLAQNDRMLKLMKTDEPDDKSPF